MFDRRAYCLDENVKIWFRMREKVRCQTGTLSKYINGTNAAPRYKLRDSTSARRQVFLSRSQPRAWILGDIRRQQVPQQQQLLLLWLACSEPALGRPMPELVWVRHTSQFCISSRFVIARNETWEKKKMLGGALSVRALDVCHLIFFCVCVFMWKTYLDCLRKKKKKSTVWSFVQIKGRKWAR